MNYLVVCNDSLGYGAAIVAGLRGRGDNAELQSWSVNGLAPFMRDRILPKFKINAWHDYSFERFQELFVEYVKKGSYDRILFLCGDVIVKRPALEWLRGNKKESRLELWLYDRMSRVPELKESLNLFHRVFTFEDSDVAFIKEHTAAEVQPLYLFCDDRCYRPDDSVSKDIDLCFIGTWQGPLYSGRRKMLAVAAELAVEKKWNFLIMGGGGLVSPLKFARDLCYANGFLRFVRPGNLSHPEINKIYQRSRVVLNCPPDNQVDGYPMRTFEVPGSGTCLITQYMKGLERLYKDDELTYYHDLNGLRSSLLQVLGDEKKRKKVALAGLNRTRRDHLLSRRLEML